MADRFDPREDPFYDGPELQGLSPEDRFDLAKQLRIAARNRRISAALDAKRTRIPWWAFALGFSFIVSGLSLAINLVSLFR